jgi:hypothetical protein
MLAILVYFDVNLTFGSPSLSQFGRYSVKVPTFKVYRYRDVPCAESMATSHGVAVSACCMVKDATI